jgi:hypothetical protein
VFLSWAGPIGGALLAQGRGGRQLRLGGSRRITGAPGCSAEILPFDGGTSEPTLGASDQGVLRIDLPRLLPTRMLIQAAAGGGKSYALRRLLEQTQGLV